MNTRLSLILITAVLLSGCVAYTVVTPGPVTVGAMTVDTAEMWNAAPSTSTRAIHRDTQVWTRDGLLLDRIVIIPGVQDGQPIFEQERDSEALPLFKADMLPNEIEELTESSIVKLFGEGQVSVTTANLRPNRFGDDRGALFDMQVTVSDGPNYRGITGAFVHEQQLFLIIYLGAEPHYYSKHREEAEAIILSARI